MQGRIRSRHVQHTGPLIIMLLGDTVPPSRPYHQVELLRSSLQAPWHFNLVGRRMSLMLSRSGEGFKLLFHRITRQSYARQARYSAAAGGPNWPFELAVNPHYDTD